MKNYSQKDILSLRERVTSVLRELGIIETDDDKTRQHIDNAMSSLADAEAELDNVMINASTGDKVFTEKEGA